MLVAVMFLFTMPTAASPSDDFNGGLHWFSTDNNGLTGNSQHGAEVAGKAMIAYLATHPDEEVVAMASVPYSGTANSMSGLLVITRLIDRSQCKCTVKHN